MGLTLRLLRQWRRYLRARYRQAKGELVVFDRYAYDALLPAPRRLGTLGRARRWLLARACPPPDLALLLDVPGEVLFARKGEHDPERLEAQRQWYLALQARRPEIVRLDATTDAETVRRTAIAFIWRDYARRTGLRNGHGG
jgi:thymidylate kinase